MTERLEKAKKELKKEINKIINTVKYNNCNDYSYSLDYELRETEKDYFTMLNILGEIRGLCDTEEQYYEKEWYEGKEQK